jgi:hypothetical protein
MSTNGDQFEGFRRAILAQGWLAPEDAAALRAECKRDYEDMRRFERQFIDADKELKALQAASALIRDALFESVRLQSHYATLLNAHDGGARRTFTYAEWLARIAALSDKPLTNGHVAATESAGQERGNAEL